MFKSARWRSDKNKIKAVFKLQFKATQVPHINADGLMLSILPGDVGKPTVRLEKAVVKDGSCQWGKPVYETMKFVQDPRTGKINEKIYHFTVSTGSSKASFVGEVSIDFASYADAVKASNLSLPIKNSNFKAVLHVSIQRQQDNIDCQRDVEESENADIKLQDHHSLNTHLSNGTADESNDSVEGGPYSKGTHIAELRRRASIGSDMATSSSDSSYGLDTPEEHGLKNNNIQQEHHPSFVTALSHPTVVSEQTVNASIPSYEEQQNSEWEWLAGSELGMSTDDSTHSSKDTLPGERSEQGSDVDIEKLKADLVALTRQVDVSELELQTLRKQIVKESKRGNDFSKEVVSLKEERDSLKAECENLQASYKRMDEAKRNKSQFEGGNPFVLIEEIKQELNHEKELNSNLRLQLQKTQESNAELLLAVQELDEMLEQKNEVAIDPTKSGPLQNSEELRRSGFRSETEEDEDQKALEDLIKEHRDAKETNVMEEKIKELYSELDIYRRDKDELEIQMEQLVLDYEILKQQNHDISYKLKQSEVQEQLKMQYECSSSFPNINELETQVESLEAELKKQSSQFSDSLATISKLEEQVISLEKELENQVEVYESDLEVVTRAKVEQEQRALRAEEALRKTRSRNVDTAERLQEEFKRLSEQMASTFDANEKVAMKALTEAGELRVQKNHLEEMLEKANKKLRTMRNDYEAIIHKLSDQINMKTNTIEHMLGEWDSKSKQHDLQKNHQEEVSGTLSQEVLRLKAEIEKLRSDNIFLREQGEQKDELYTELEDMRILMEKSNALVERGNMERNELVSTIALIKNAADKTMEELDTLRCVKDEKETMVNLLQAELETVKVQCDNLKNSLFEDEKEKEKLRKQLFQLKGDLKKKDDALTLFEKKLKDSNGRTAASYGTKTNSRNNKPAIAPYGNKEVSILKEKIKLLEGHIKSKETALITSTNSFLEKEKDLQDKIEKLEGRLEELDRNCATLCENGILKDATAMCNAECMSKDNGSIITSNKSNHEDLKTTNINGDAFLTELASVKEKNKLMESDLKEMQERYLEISLKFAEVEGERQQLVMTVRNLKNAIKN